MARASMARRRSASVRRRIPVRVRERQRTMKTLQDFAREFSRAFESGKRDSGAVFRKLKDDAPSWAQGVCRDAHDSARMMPDDLRYEMIEQAADALAEFDDVDEARDSLEPDVYTNDLIAWLASRNDRICYVDDARRDYGDGGTTEQMIAAGQLAEKHEVFDSVHAALTELVESQDEETEVA
jgi:hypothetical protein